MSELNPQNSITASLDLARNGCDDSRNRVGRWLLDHVRIRIEALASKKHLPGSVSAIHGDILAKLVNSDAIANAPNRAYLIGATTRAIIEVIADTARRTNRAKRKSGGTRMPMEMMVEILQAKGMDVIGLTDAIRDLSEQGETQARQAKVVVLRYFGGMSVREVARELEISTSTVESDWRLARVWLYRELCDNPE